MKLLRMSEIQSHSAQCYLNYQRLEALNIARDLDQKPVKKKKSIQPQIICPTISQFGF